MTASTRAKFQCSHVEDYGQSKKVVLRAIYAPTETTGSEDNRFTKATPAGEIWMTIDNPAASCQFKPGRTYYLDLHEAPASDWNKWAYEEVQV